MNRLQAGVENARYLRIETNPAIGFEGGWPKSVRKPGFRGRILMARRPDLPLHGRPQSAFFSGVTI